MSVLYVVERAFSAFNDDCFTKVFEIFVQPQQESALQAWRLWAAKNINTLERVQRHATKLVTRQGSQSYETGLSNLDLFPLRYRELREDLILTFSILRVQDCCLVSGDFFELAKTTHLSGHPFNSRETGARLDARKYFLSKRLLEAWNILPLEVVISESLGVF
ncbi:unnamed protein product [Dibothriocephalus latus]|uniref:Uncharacterized protein n=1 Tax=Dibothriocephalus latus TaxID=60516 RepID=A0A3P7LNJ3_DIBLA|nr:unnamed protein product [Dibothriocephalus latus]